MVYKGWLLRDDFFGTSQNKSKVRLFKITSAERVLRDDERDKTSSNMYKFKGYN